jgi:dipeptidase E
MIKLLLTSNGVTNQSIHNALVGLLGKPIAECKALFIPTAIYPFPNGAYYAWQAMFGNKKSALADLGWKSVGVLELTALQSIERSIWAPSVEEADALLVWGGDPLYLSYWMQQSGLADLLLSSSRHLVYVGVSAGSMAATHIIGETYSNLPNASHNTLTSEDMVFDTPQGQISRTFVTAYGAGLVDFSIIPHLYGVEHPDTSETNAKIWASKIPAPTYAIDDQSAIKVVNGVAEIVSEGNWKLFNV